MHVTHVMNLGLEPWTLVLAAPGALADSRLSFIIIIISNWSQCVFIFVWMFRLKFESVDLIFCFYLSHCIHQGTSSIQNPIEKDYIWYEVIICHVRDILRDFENCLVVNTRIGPAERPPPFPHYPILNIKKTMPHPISH